MKRHRGAPTLSPLVTIFNESMQKKNMKKNLLGLLFVYMSFIAGVSCSKEKTSNIKTYYGNVNGELKGLPGTPDMDIYINQEKMGELSPGGGFGTLRVVAGELVKLE